MSVSSITSAFASYAQKLTGGSATGGTAGSSSAMQEATETKAQTQKEAKAGDHVAIAKLKREQQAAAAPTEQGKGATVDQKS